MAKTRVTIKTTNPNIIEALLYPLAGEVDDDEFYEIFSDIKIDYPLVMRSIIEKYFYSDFSNEPEAFKLSIKPILLLSNK